MLGYAFLKASDTDAVGSNVNTQQVWAAAFQDCQRILPAIGLFDQLIATQW